jgi:hypothetical protein
LGLTRAQWQALRPKLERENELALEVWRFCGGWNPERLPIAVAYYAIEDVDLLITRLLAIDGAISAHQAAQRS